MPLRSSGIGSFAAATAVVCLGACFAETARGNLVTYAIQGTGDVTLGGVSYSDVGFAITVEANTNLITFDPVYGLLYLEGSSAKVSVSGVGDAAWLEVPVINLYQDPFNLLYLAGSPSGSLFFDAEADLFATYDLASSAGPVPLLTFESFGPTPTSLGDFFVDGLTSPATFQATVSAVPEPAGLTLLGIAFVGLACYTRRRHLVPTTWAVAA